MFMIKSDDQRQKTLKQIQGFEAQFERIKERFGQDKAESFSRSYRSLVAQFREQVRIYDELKEKGIEPVHPRHLSEVGPYLVKARIASGLTQADLAKKLDVSQPMIHKYENMEYQGVSIETLSKAAKALGVSLDLQIFRKHGSTVYSSVRQEAAILCFVQQINNKFLGKVKLMKLLYYMDYEWIQKKGVSITGDKYLALQYGPVPKHAQETLSRLKEKGFLRIEKVKAGDYDQERYLALKDPDLSVFTHEEIEHMNQIARRFEFWTATQMSDLSHEDWPWQSTRLGEEIRFS